MGEGVNYLFSKCCIVHQLRRAHKTLNTKIKD